MSRRPSIPKAVPIATATATLDKLRQVQQGRPAPLPVVIGCSAAGHAIPRDAMLNGYLRAFAANLTSATVRFIPLGQTDGQRAIAAMEQVTAETGGCPHTAIREDASINLAAIAALRGNFPDLDLIIIESGGDNLAATFSPELADLMIYVIDVSAGDKIQRKGGPGITRSGLLVINKIDLAPMVGGDGTNGVQEFVERQGGLRTDVM